MQVVVMASLVCLLGFVDFCGVVGWWWDRVFIRNGAQRGLRRVGSAEEGTKDIITHLLFAQ